MRLVSRWFPPLFLTLVVACAPSIHDVDGLPVERPVLIGSAPGARLVVDSTASGWRAVAELYRSSVIPAPLPAFAPVPRLRCDEGHTFHMIRARTGAAWCRDAAIGDPDPPRRYGHSPRGSGKCFRQQVVEYRLGHPPAPEEIWTLVHRDTVRPVRWDAP